MKRLLSRGTLTGALATISLLVLAAVAFSAVSGKYKGTSPQTCSGTQLDCGVPHGKHLQVTFRIKNDKVAIFAFHINDKCPDGHTLIVSSHGYPPMNIGSAGKFGGKFGVANDPTGGKQESIINGRVSGKTVKAAIKDVGLSQRENALCHGSTTFTAHKQ